MNCWHCKTELIWGGDHDMDGEDYPLNDLENFSMMTNLSCPKCNSFVEVLPCQEMPTIEIPDINIPEIYIPDVPEIYSPHYLTIKTT